MTAAMKDGTCTGCGKPTPKSDYQMFKAPDGREYLLCPGRTSRRFSEVCFKKAIERLRICPGCRQAHKVAPGFLCYECQDHLQQANAAAATRHRLEWYWLPRGVWVPYLGYESQTVIRDLEADCEESKILDACGRAMALGRFEPYKDRVPYGHIKTPIVPDGHRATSDGSGPAFETTEAAAENIKLFLTMIREQLQVQRLTGRQEGRSLLAGLAAGKLSLNDWTEQNKKMDEKP